MLAKKSQSMPLLAVSIVSSAATTLGISYRLVRKDPAGRLRYARFGPLVSLATVALVAVLKTNQEGSANPAIAQSAKLISLPTIVAGAGLSTVTNLVAVKFLTGRTEVSPKSALVYLGLVVVPRVAFGAVARYRTNAALQALEAQTPVDSFDEFLRVTTQSDADQSSVDAKDIQS